MKKRINIFYFAHLKKISLFASVIYQFISDYVRDFLTLNFTIRTVLAYAGGINLFFQIEIRGVEVLG